MLTHRKTFSHVNAKELPKTWVKELHPDQEEVFTVILLAEKSPKTVAKPPTKVEEVPFFGMQTDEDDELDAEIQARGLSLENNPAIGMWADREEMKNVEGYVRNLRKPRPFKNAD